MVNRSSKRVSKIVKNVATDVGSLFISNNATVNADPPTDANNNSINPDFASVINLSSEKTPSLSQVTSEKQNDTISLANGITRQKLSQSIDRSVITFDSEMNNSDDDVESVLAPRSSNKRKRAPTESLVNKKIAKKSSTNTTLSLSSILDDSASDSDEVSSHRPAVSPSIWDYATRSDDRSYALCSLCNKKILTNNWSTTSLRRHLIQVHDKKELILSNKKKRKISTIGSNQKEELHKLSVEAIIKDSLPFNAFKKPGLSKLMQEAVPGYQPIHRNVVTRRIKRLKSEQHAKLIEQLKSVESISITTDFWTDRANRSYVAITGHFCTDDHQLKTKVLVFSSFDQRHSADKIAQTLTTKLRKLGILHKISRIVSDGAKNLTNAIDSMSVNAERIWCVAHRLHLVITTALALWPKKKKKNIRESKQDLLSSNSSEKNPILTNKKHQPVEKQQTTEERNRHRLSEINDIEGIDTNGKEKSDEEVITVGYDVHDEEESMVTDDDDNESVSTEHGVDDDDNEEEEDDGKDEEKDGENEDEVSGRDQEDDDDDGTTINEQTVFKDCWEEGVEVDLNDPNLSKDQLFTLLTMVKCRHLINMIKQSTVLTMYFTKQRKLLNIQRNVIRDICIRWNSSFLMINTLLILRPAIEKLFDDKHDLNLKHKQIEKLNKLELNSAEWNHLTQLHHVLEAFYFGTNIVSGKHYPSIGSAYFILTKLKDFLTNDSNDNVIVKRLKKLLNTKMIRYFEEDRNQLNLLKFHSYFDPIGHRALLDIDKRWIEFEIKQMLLDGTTNPDNLLTSSSSQLTSSVLSAPSTTTAVTTTPTNTTSATKVNTKSKPSAMEAFLGSVGDSCLPKQTTGLRANIVEEIHNYRVLVNKYNVRHEPSASSCLTFWKRYETSFPHLYKLAKQFICTPATSVPSESSFSISSYVGRKERSRLSPKNLAATVFLKIEMTQPQQPVLAILNNHQQILGHLTRQQQQILDIISRQQQQEQQILDIISRQQQQEQ